VLSVRRRRGGELDRGESRCPRSTTRGTSAPCLPGYAWAHGQRCAGGIQVSMWCNEGHTGSAVQGPLWHAFDHVSSASGTGCTRHHRRVPGTASPLAQRQAAIEQRAALTRRYMARGGDAMALGRGRIGGGTAVQRW
jgi:hypothetical protein